MHLCAACATAKIAPPILHQVVADVKARITFAAGGALPGAATPWWQLAGEAAFSPPQLAEVAAALGSVDIYDAELFALCATHVEPKLQEIPVALVNRMAEAFDKVRHDDVDFLRALRRCVDMRSDRKPCKLYRSGGCKFGELCKFSHA